METNMKRKETKRNEMKRNETKRNETKRNETKRNETKGCAPMVVGIPMKSMQRLLNCSE